MPTVTSSTAFDEHQAWLQNLRTMHEQHMAKVAQPQQPSPLPVAPMMWGMPGMAGSWAGSSVDEAFAGIAIVDRPVDEDEFDAPVYRSIGGAMLGEAGASSSFGAEEEESPRYRSLSGAAEEEGYGMSMEDATAAWLESMPPLIRRQNALAGLVLP